MSDEQRHPGKLLFTLPNGYRPNRFTGLSLSDNPYDGRIMIYEDGEVRFIRPGDDDD